MANEDKFIEGSTSIYSMLNNISEMVAIIYKDFLANGHVHCDYVYEKLSRAKYDLDILVDYAEKKKNSK